LKTLQNQAFAKMFMKLTQKFHASNLASKFYDLNQFWCQSSYEVCELRYLFGHWYFSL